MFIPSLSYIKKTYTQNIDNQTPLREVNKQINLRLKVISTSQSIFCKINSFSTKLACIGIITCVFYPFVVAPVLAISMISAISLSIFKLFNRVENSILKDRTRTYCHVSFPNLDRGSLENKFTSIFNQTKFIESEKFKRLPEYIQEQFKTYMTAYQAAGDHAEKQMNMLFDETCKNVVKRNWSKEKTTKVVQEKCGGLLSICQVKLVKLFRTFMNSFFNQNVVVQTSKWSKEEVSKIVQEKCESILSVCQAEREKLFHIFIDNFNQYAYKYYTNYQQTLGTQSCRLLSAKDYKNKVLEIIDTIKKVIMIVSLDEVLKDPLTVEKDLNWMQKNLDYKYYHKFL